uniref:Alanine--tRNA ligase n=1 Tax=Lygus hesperus TaxID=30085 RepID=A0A0A9WKK1_LYGHE
MKAASFVLFFVFASVQASYPLSWDELFDIKPACLMKVIVNEVFADCSTTEIDDKGFEVAKQVRNDFAREIERFAHEMRDILRRFGFETFIQSIKQILRRIVRLIVRFITALKRAFYKLIRDVRCFSDLFHFDYLKRKILTILEEYLVKCQLNIALLP